MEAVQPSKALECVEQLPSSLSRHVGGSTDLFRMLDCESDSVNRDPGLIGHFKFHRRGRRLDVGFNRLDHLMHEF